MPWYKSRLHDPLPYEGFSTPEAFIVAFELKNKNQRLLDAVRLIARKTVNTSVYRHFSYGGNLFKDRIKTLLKNYRIMEASNIKELTGKEWVEVMFFILEE